MAGIGSGWGLETMFAILSGPVPIGMCNKKMALRFFPLVVASPLMRPIILEWAMIPVENATVPALPFIRFHVSGHSRPSQNLRAETHASKQWFRYLGLLPSPPGADEAASVFLKL